MPETSDDARRLLPFDWRLIGMAMGVCTVIILAPSVLQDRTSQILGRSVKQLFWVQPLGVFGGALAAAIILVLADRLRHRRLALGLASGIVCCALGMCVGLLEGPGLGFWIFVLAAASQGLLTGLSEFVAQSLSRAHREDAAAIQAEVRGKMTVFAQIGMPVVIGLGAALGAPGSFAILAVCGCLAVTTLWAVLPDVRPRGAERRRVFVRGIRRAATRLVLTYSLMGGLGRASQQLFFGALFQLLAATKHLGGELTVILLIAGLAGPLIGGMGKHAKARPLWLGFVNNLALAGAWLLFLLAWFGRTSLERQWWVQIAGSGTLTGFAVVIGLVNLATVCGGTGSWLATQALLDELPRDGSEFRRNAVARFGRDLIGSAGYAVGSALAAWELNVGLALAGIGVAVLANAVLVAQGMTRRRKLAGAGHAA